MAHAGEEAGFLSEIEISWAEDLVSGSGPSGEAIRTGETTVMEDFCLGHATPQLTRSAERRGYRSAVCLPLHDDLRVFGALTLYGAEPISTSEHEIMMLRELANDLSFGIGNIRSREERRRTEGIVVKVAQAVSSGTGSEFFDLLARNMVEALGARGGIIGRLDSVTHSIHSISYFLDGKAMEPVSYHLAGTPCEKVIVGDICVFEEGVRDSFPEDHLLGALDIEAYVGIPLLNQHGGVTGIMAVLFSEPLKETALVRSTLRIFAARAASELDRKVADARISEQASLLDKARDAILVRDLDHTITYWNKSAERLYGWTAEEAIGRSVESLLYQETTAFGKAHLQTLLAGEWTGELIQIDKNGLELTIEGRWTLVRDDKGRPQSVFAINTDISEHRKLEQQFLRAQRLESIGTLAGGIAHDLNNILAPITMAVELMKMRSPDDKSVELLDTISGSAKRGANLVGQVLSFARGMEGCRVAVHPGRIISEIECILRDTFPRNIVLDLHSGRDLWPINGDPTQLHQVLLNLCVNARDAISGEGKIRVSAENLQVDEPFAAINLEAKEGPHVCIVVEDTGEGLAPEIMDRIFDPFFTTKSVGKGTGLGLPTTLAIVKSHGGFIRTDSKPGEGTCFRIYLPAFPETEDPPAAIAPAALPKGAGRTVLIVDDEDAIRHIAQKTLEMFGYRTLVAANGQQAISMYERYQSAIDIVLTDMMMPVMDGPAAIRGLVEINPAVRIVATSGLPPDPESVRNTRDFLPKPYSAEALLRCLDQALRD
jgi:PAS domain S-box-containing protein